MPRRARSGDRCARAELERLVAELLSADAGFVHEAALGHGEDRHALVVLAGRGRVLLATARTRARPGRSGLRTRRGGDGDGVDVRPELEVAADELLQRALVLEEDDLAVAFAAELQ